jgi:hypothetical protein
MKKILFAMSVFCIFQLSAQRDTVFVDPNDSAYSVLPSGYMIIDTVEVITQESRFIRSSTQCAGGGGSRIGQLPDSTFYVFWKVEVKNNGLLGRYYFQNNSVLLDSISVSSTSQSIQYTDTFKINSDSVTTNWTCNATGTDSIELTEAVYFTNIQINITPIISVNIEIHNAVKQKITVFPNPTSSSIRFSGDGVKEGQLIQIYNVTGELLKTISVKGQIVKIEDLRNGLHFLRVGASTVPFIKN